MSSAMRPIVPRGRPLLPVGIFVHLLPPSVLCHRPLPGPPPTNPHADRWRSYIETHRFSGLLGSMMRSVAPVSRLPNRTFVQFLPPSVVLNTPRSSFGP